MVVVLLIKELAGNSNTEKIRSLSRGLSGKGGKVGA